MTAPGANAQQGNGNVARTSFDSGHIDMGNVLFFNYCGENVQGKTGVFEYGFTFQYNGAGKYLLKSDVKAHGMGTGVFTNTEYKINETTTYVSTGDYFGGRFELANSARWKLTAKSPLGQSMFVRIHYKVVVTPDGRLTANFYDFQIECE
jgi:hypothetical protein